MSDAILLLGASGFVGQALAPALASSGRKVIAVSRSPALMAAENIEFVTGDFTSPEEIAPLLERCASVIHLASATTPGVSASKPLLELNANLRLTLALLESLQDRPTCQLLYLSSGGTLYGDAGTSPAAEHLRINPKSYYGAGKAASEHFITAWSHQHNGAATILRPSNLYGPGQTTRQGFGIIPTAFDAVRSGKPLNVWGDGEAVRDYLYIDDFISLCMASIGTPMPPGTRVLNAASGQGTSLNELFTAIETVTGAPLPRRYISGRPVDVTRIVLDADEARKCYEWSASTTLNEGLAQAWHWYSTQQ